MERLIKASLKRYVDTFLDVIDLFPEYIFIKDPEGFYVLANEKWCKLLGITKQDYLGKSDYDIYPKDLAESYKKSDSFVCNKRIVYESIDEQIIKDGSRITIQYSKTPLFSETGEICGILGVFRDVSLEHDEKFRHLRLKDASLEASVDGIAFFDTQGYLITQNPSLEKFYPEMVLKDDETTLEEMIEALLNRQFFQKVEDFIFSKEKIYVIPEVFSSLSGRYISLILYKVLGKTGKWVGLMLSLRDNTELREAEERYRNLVEDANSIILKIGISGEILFMNQYAQKIFGFSTEEILGENAQGRIFRDDMLQRIFTDPERHKNSESECFKRGGGRLLVAWTNRIYYDNEGEPKELLCIGQDITEKRETEKTLAHAQKMEALGTLINGLAHDLNNLLTGINGYLSSITLQNEAYQDETIQNSISRIQGIISSSSELIRTILPLGKKSELQKESIDINMLVGDVIEIVRHSRKKPIDYQKRLDPSLPKYDLYKGEMQQVILNILLNAVDAIPETGKITVSTGIDTAREALYIKILDSGIGMSEETLSHIFEPYYTTKEAKKGTGLGLTMAYSIVKNHGGSIDVESAKGIGTTFTILFPIIQNNTI